VLAVVTTPQEPLIALAGFAVAHGINVIGLAMVGKNGTPARGTLFENSTAAFSSSKPAEFPQLSLISLGGVLVGHIHFHTYLYLHNSMSIIILGVLFPHAMQI